MKLRIIFAACLLFCWCSSSIAQTVSTILAKQGARLEGITWGGNGQIYVVDFATGQVFKLSLNGVAQQVGPAFNGALGGAMDSDHNFYFSEYNTGKIIKIKPDDSYEEYCSGLTGPAGILIDDANDIMYVSNYSGHSISKIDMTAATPSPVILASGSPINGPDGLAFSPEGEIISTNYNNNKIQKIALDGTVSPFATVSASTKTGYIVRIDDHYYVTGADGTADIYKITLDGQVSRFAGIGQSGYMDGPAATARFTFPNGIATNATQDSLLITESNTSGRVRLISMLDAPPTSTKDLTSPTISIGPNPASDYLQIAWEMEEKALVQITLLDIKGALIDTLMPLQERNGKVQVDYQLSDQMSKGTYIVQCKIGTKILSKQVVLN